MSKISIIIPIYNEEIAIASLLKYIENNTSQLNPIEIIVVDGGSSDDSELVVNRFEKVRLVKSEKGRAKQSNTAARVATGEILYFLHCDSFPPKNFDQLIINQIQKNNKAGCFRMKFDYSHPVLVVSQWFTRINHISCRGGDQSLFISKDLFDEIKGFNEDYIIYEDNEIVSRLYHKNQFVVVPETIITSARRYRKNGVWYLQFRFAVIHLMRRLGCSNQKMLDYYKKHIKD